MMTRMKLSVMSALVVLVASTVSWGAQGRGLGRGRANQPPAPADDNAAATPAEIQRMFDAYALVQAEQQLALSDEVFARFLVRYKALQDARRKALQEHTRIVVALAALTRGDQPDESQLKDRLQALAEADARGAADIKRAYDAVDQVLDVRQQARFRVFEEQMERRKLELVTRARQANRAQQRQQP
jgi:hypothetical protein